MAKVDRFTDRLITVLLSPILWAQGRGVLARLLAMTGGLALAMCLAFVLLPLLLVGAVWMFFDSLGHPS